MLYKVTKTVPSILDLITECTPCHGSNPCIGPACKLYQVSKFLDMSCAGLFYDYTDKVIEFLKGDIDIEKVEDFKDSEDLERANKNGSFISKDATIVNLTGKTLMYNNGEYNMVDVSDIDHDTKK